MASDPPGGRPPSSPDRRRLLVALGYAGASVAAIGKLGWSVFGSHATPSAAAARPATRAGSTPGQPVAPPALSGAPAQPDAGHVYDIAITGGRVIDPETGFDQVADVGVDGGAITAVSLTTLQAKTSIDAKGKVVAPGFIDVLSYEPNDEGAFFKIGDGVTTNLGMHGMQEGDYAKPFFARYTGRCPVNFGGAFPDHWVRYHQLGLGVGDTATPSQVSALADTFEQELHNGWIGIDFEPEYTPGVDFAEMKGLSQVAQRYGVPVFVHGRHSSADDEHLTVPEIIEIAKQTGAAVHVSHLPSTGGTWDIDQALAEIHAAKDAGYSVSACCYPYNYWATYLGSARFSDGWQQRYHISYNDLQIAGTNERVTASTFAGYQRRNKLAVAYAIPEDSVRKALRDPLTMIGSDAILTSGNNHPRATGCFARVLGPYVRDAKVLTLTEALTKMTIQPAKLLEGRAPALTRKGRLQRGADADICVFDPATVADTSTVADPAQYSAGIDWVLVAGQVAKTPAGVQTNVRAGQPIASQLQPA